MKKVVRTRLLEHCACLSITQERQAELFEARLRTIAHEVGHVILGPRHPGNAPEFVRGVVGLSPLPGTDHKRRLMFAGKAARLVSPEEIGTQLVKMAWDRTESWLNEMIADPDLKGVQ